MRRNRNQVPGKLKKMKAHTNKYVPSGNIIRDQ